MFSLVKYLSDPDSIKTLYFVNSIHRLELSTIIILSFNDSFEYKQILTDVNILNSNPTAPNGNDIFVLCNFSQTI